MTPEAKGRQCIDALLAQAGWHVCDMADANIHASRGVALREFPLNAGYGCADSLLYIDGRAAGVVEAKKAGSTRTGAEVQSARYANGLPENLPAWLRPLPFSHESMGIEIHFTQGPDPHPRARSVFAFHRPETLAALLQYLPASSANLPNGAVHTGAAKPSGMLTQQNQRRWAGYRIADGSPQLERLAVLSAETRALLPLAEPARQNKKLPVDRRKARIQILCQGRWLSTSELAALVDRDAEKLQSRFLTAMVRDGALELRYPEVRDRPDPACRSVEQIGESLAKLSE